MSVKLYLAGALGARSGQLHWVEDTRKTSVLFLALLSRSLQVYAPPAALVSRPDPTALPQVRGH
jgi:hypothetical protein